MISSSKKKSKQSQFQCLLGVWNTTNLSNTEKVCALHFSQSQKGRTWYVTHIPGHHSQDVKNTKTGDRVLGSAFSSSV